MGNTLYYNILALCAFCLFPEASFQFQDYDRRPLSPEDYAFLRSSPPLREKRSSYPNFKYLFVSHNGSVSSSRGDSGTQVEVTGSPATSDKAIQVAAGIVGKMLKNMPDDIFRIVALKSQVGVFTKKETLTIYPEYKRYKNGNCGKSCKGNCVKTCSRDGRKYEDLAGLGGRRAVVLDANILCTQKDPYHHLENILIHELPHSIYQYALSAKYFKLINDAYANAKKKKIWNLKSYTMSSAHEYFAEATTVFFGANIYKKVPTRDMNLCGSKLCWNEVAGRKNIKKHDPALYNVLLQVYDGGQSGLASDISICPTHFG